MVNTNHRELTGVALHEPKGVAAASDGQTYVADGAGSGAWTSGGGTEIGSIITWPTSSVPTGFLECNGDSKSTTGDYAALFAVLSYTYGGSGANFNIPNLRGQFLRGFDNSEGIDPDASGRTSRGDVAATTGDNVGTKQAYAIKDHDHTSKRSNVLSNIDTGSNQSKGEGADTTGGVNTSGTFTVNSSTESRPVNIYMMFCIKF